MYYTVTMCSLRNTVEFKESETLSFRPTGNYTYMNIFENKEDALEYKNKVEFFILNYDMFSHHSYHKNSNKDTHYKNENLLFNSLLNLNFEETENLFKEEFVIFTDNLVSSEAIKLIRENFDVYQYYSAYLKVSQGNSEEKQLKIIQDILSEIENTKRARTLAATPGFLTDFR